MNTKEITSKIDSLAEELGGTAQHWFTSDHSGRTSQKIVIEYNIKAKGE
tara:strand:+ start:67 stop:213 length:147 start_codon:yes stop_codon:yes gene_type:complete